MKKPKPNILIFIDWFEPAYKAGGPIQSVLNLVKQLDNLYQFYIVTSDTDIDVPLELKAEQKNNWIKKQSYTIIYLSKTHQNLKTYKSIFAERNYDAVYLNSLFSPKFTLLPIIGIPSNTTKIILAPKGMLGNAALSIKPIKKKIFIKIFKLLGWHKKVTWHASSTSEKIEIIENFGDNVSIKIASDLSKSSDSKFIKKHKEKNQLKVFFLSRIHPIKNLLKAIEILGQVNKAFKIYFTIIGPVEDKAYWNLCKAELRELPNHINISIMGSVPHAEIFDILKAQHLLFLPTKNENYGHAIVESWQSGCPAIISDQTPWTDLKKNKIGAALPLLSRETLFIEEIEYFAKMDTTEFDVWSKCCKTYARKITNTEKHIADYMEIFDNKTSTKVKNDSFIN